MDAIDVAPTVSPPRLEAPVLRQHRTELILEALRTALADPREHRLFNSGKFSGLFPSRFGTSADAALHSIKEGLFETTRTEAKGKLIVEWVRATAKAVAYLHDHDSPRAVLRELRDTIGETRSGIPLWMADVRGELAGLGAKFEEQARTLSNQLDELTRRVEGALRRLDTSYASPMPNLPGVNWAVVALEYLDRRMQTGLPAACPLGELFQAVRQHDSSIRVPDFHDGLRRLHDTRAVRLHPHTGMARMDAEFALLIGSELCSAVSR